MIDESTLQRYLKVKALSERGSPGERDNASRIRQKMEKEYEGIAAAAAVWERFNGGPQGGSSHSTPGPSTPGPQPPPGVWPSDGPNASQGPSSGGNWETIFDWTKTAFKEAYGFAETVANVALGRQVADHVQISTRLTRADSVLITYKMSLTTYNQARSLTRPQREAFRDALHEMLDDTLDQIIASEDD